MFSIVSNQLPIKKEAILDGNRNSKINDSFLTVNKAFEDLIGEAYSSNPNVLDKWVYEFLKQSAQGTLTKKDLKLVHILHLDNQKNLISAAYKLAIQNNRDLTSKLLTEEKQNLCLIKEFSSESQFDITKETMPKFLVSMTALPHLTLKSIALVASSMAWMVTFSYTVFAPSYRCTTHLNHPQDQGLSHGAIHNGCLVRDITNNSPLFMYDYLPNLLSVAGGILSISYFFLQKQLRNSISKTFEDCSQRMLNNNEIEKAFLFSKKYPRLISSKKINQIGMKALEKENIELAQQAAEILPKNEGNKLFGQIISKLQNKIKFNLKS